MRYEEKKYTVVTARNTENQYVPVAITNNHIPSIRLEDDTRPNVLIIHLPDLTYRYFSYAVGGLGRIILSSRIVLPNRGS
ncbi:hypothetical protein MT325_m187L [Paramecium bursaria chlorella virus MT325]|uniref:Uncharacterized protein m187L n=1 Tax=Paramecium bursaria Chlorella virus MT325 TaxID=346932 RepID=A7ITR7_PBCVM|nr:hypothetical protein MT325_m187L [Paramecium bursaria chlorella virus MT325]